MNYLKIHTYQTSVPKIRKEKKTSNYERETIIIWKTKMDILTFHFYINIYTHINNGTGYLKLSLQSSYIGHSY